MLRSGMEREVCIREKLLEGLPGAGDVVSQSLNLDCGCADVHIVIFPLFICVFCTLLYILFITSDNMKKSEGCGREVRPWSQLSSSQEPIIKK